MGIKYCAANTLDYANHIGCSGFAPFFDQLAEAKGEIIIIIISLLDYLVKIAFFIAHFPDIVTNI